MYSLRALGKMVAEPVRRGAYFSALEAAIRPGSVVLEIGTGPGVFALHAARCGAAKVYAVEPSDAIQVARELVAANGFSDRIELMQGLSTEVELPQRVDVVFSDLRGVLPLFGQHVPAIVDARQRHLKADGVLIPAVDTLWSTVVEAASDYRDLTIGWNEPLGFDLSVALKMVTSCFAKANLEQHQCLAEPRKWAELDYARIAHDEVRGELDWQVGRAGSAHGIAVWFDTRLFQNIGFSSAPGEPELIYGQALFPFPCPQVLEAGDRVTVELRAVPVAGDYVWLWRTVLAGSGGRREFRQTSFDADPLSPSRLRKRAPRFVARLGASGQLASFVLERMNGANSLAEIAGELLAAFPNELDGQEAALARVAELAETYSSSD